MSAKTRSSHDAAVVVAIIVVAAATAVTCLHININSEVQTMMKKNPFGFTTNKNKNTIEVGPIYLFGFLQCLIVQLQQCVIPVFAIYMMTNFIDSLLNTAYIV